MDYFLNYHLQLYINHHIHILFDDKKIDKWITSEIDKALEKKERQRKATEKYQEEKERQEYERLKEKFGK